MKIKNIKREAFLRNLEKSYTEGVYADTPQNRKLGRVGMSYKEWTSKQQGEDKQKFPSTIKELSEEQFNKILDKLGWDKNEIKGSSFEEKRDNFFKDKNKEDIKEIIDEGLKRERKEKGNFYTEKMKNPKRGYGGKNYKKVETSKKGNKKTWDKLEDFYKEGSAEKKLWDLWYSFQKSGNPSRMSQMVGIFSDKFPDIGMWKQTAPNTGKAKITAFSKNGDIVAEIDLGGNKVDLPALQTFMDKCHVGKGENEILVDKTEILKNAEGKKLDAIIKYSNSADDEVYHIEGIKVADNATNEEKRIAIAKFYKEAAEGDAENLDGIIEEALDD